MVCSAAAATGGGDGNDGGGDGGDIGHDLQSVCTHFDSPTNGASTTCCSNARPTRPDNRMSRRQTHLSGPLQLQVDTLPMYRACLREAHLVTVSIGPRSPMPLGNQRWTSDPESQAT